MWALPFPLPVLAYVVRPLGDGHSEGRGEAPASHRNEDSVSNMSDWERWLELCARIDGLPRSADATAIEDTTAALRLVSAMESANPRPWFTDAQRASIRLAVGDTAGALNALEQSARSSGGMWSTLIPVADPAYDPVRHTTRFAALMRQAGLDVQTFNALRAKQPR